MSLMSSTQQARFSAGEKSSLHELPPPRGGSRLAAVSEGPKDDGSLLALDLGTRTGWAVCTPEGRITSGTESFRPGRFEGGGMRYLRFRRWLENLKATVGPIEAIYFEEVRRHTGVDAAHACDDAYYRFPPDSAAIDRMEETMRWVLWLGEEDRYLVWMRAEGWRGRDICRRVGCDCTTAWRRWQRALAVVVGHLNG